ncbi:beta-N-acetylhexosaminidase [Marinilabilia salmonicolor]|uniref:beta-N-acetylhexosaminidase n=1 Tax=Marinilabilia salmonicolor TaxID=989 RepID=A0A368UXH1_9BACT|nr:beta-N-acetylhexosaminidase [Marinilabilia salmonicolor]RCW32775.1 hexosaminidase [Marinilabilia salmonicolor]
MRKKAFKLSIWMLIVASLTGCGKENEASRELAVIPKPVKMKSLGGDFQFNEKTVIVVSGDDEQQIGVAHYLSKLLSSATGFRPEVNVEDNSEDNSIFLEIDKSITGAPGCYSLLVTESKVSVSAPGVTGLFYGVQTLRQLLPPEIESDVLFPDMEWKVPAVEIFDEPAFPYRGLHLDVSRHFFPVSFIKKYIDLLALHKMNVFHWHLTDDQGWRLEIKKYPMLQEVASQREETLVGHGLEEPFVYDGKPYGGYYTQEEVKEVVKYAEERFVTVIPEIEMPGHAQAALAAYPHLGCTGGPYKTVTRWGVFPEVFCAGKEETFQFLEDVLLEVMELFPSEYIHIGGDECPKTRWEECEFCQARIADENLKNEQELQSYFVHRIEEFLNRHGRSIIGWDEIMEGGLAPGATVMSWQGEKGGIQAAKMGHNVIMTPVSHLYFDYYQTDPEGEPLAIGHFLPLEKVYSYHPVPDTLTSEEAKFIIGAQGNLWSEYIKTPGHAEYMALPRAVALSEILWTPVENKNYNDFLQRLDVHKRRLNVLGVNYFKE